MSSGPGAVGDRDIHRNQPYATDKLLAGAIPVTLLALFADFLSELLGLALISRGLRLSD